MQLTETLSSFCTIRQKEENWLTVSYKDKDIEIRFDTFSDTIEISTEVMNEEIAEIEDSTLFSDGAEFVNALNCGIPSYQFLFDDFNLDVTARKILKFSDALRSPFLLHVEICRIFHLITQVTKAYSVHQWSDFVYDEKWLQLLMDTIDSWVAEELLNLNILYIQSWPGDAAIASSLQKLLPNCRVIYSDIPMEPRGALERLNSIVHEHSINLVVGAGMGALLAMHTPCRNKVLINPTFHFEEHEPMPRLCKDGMRECVVTSEMGEADKQLVATAFEGNAGCNIVGIFANKGKTGCAMVDSKNEYLRHYSNIRHYHGTLCLREDEIQLAVVPAILQVTLNEHRG